ncbi:unnamed protein product [Lepidochelys olivacea]
MLWCICLCVWALHFGNAVTVNTGDHFSCEANNSYVIQGMPLQLNGIIAIYANERLTNCYVVWEDKSSGKTMTAFMVDSESNVTLENANGDTLVSVFRLDC